MSRRGIVLDHDQAVAQWAFETFKYKPVKFDRCAGIINEGGKLIGAIFFQSFNGSNVEVSYYGANTVTLGIVKWIGLQVLNSGCSRMTFTITKKHKRLIRAAKKLGFQYEGTCRRFYGDADNDQNAGVRLVMFRERVAEIVGKNARDATSGVQHPSHQQPAAAG